MADTVSTKPAPRTRRDEEKEKRREAILDAAEHVIAKHGWAHADFGKVATRARLSRPLVYFYFSNRDELFHAVCCRGMIILRARFEAAVAAHRKGLDQLMALGRAYCLFARDQPLYFDLISQYQEKVFDPNCLSTVEHDAHEQGVGCVGCVVQALQNGLADGSIRRSIGDPRPAAISVWAFAHGLIQIAARKECMLHEAFQLDASKMVEHGLALLRSSFAADRG